MPSKNTCVPRDKMYIRVFFYSGGLYVPRLFFDNSVYECRKNGVYDFHGIAAIKIQNDCFCVFRIFVGVSCRGQFYGTEIEIKDNCIQKI